MDPIGFLIVAIVVVAVIALVARRWRGGDQSHDRGPYSTAMEARGGFAALGTTIDEPDRQAQDAAVADRVEDA
jgi:hypothetical protein